VRMVGKVLLFAYLGGPVVAIVVSLLVEARRHRALRSLLDRARPAFESNPPGHEPSQGAWEPETDPQTLALEAALRRRRALLGSAGCIAGLALWWFAGWFAWYEWTSFERAKAEYDARLDNTAELLAAVDATLQEGREPEIPAEAVEGVIGLLFDEEPEYDPSRLPLFLAIVALGQMLGSLRMVRRAWNEGPLS
jgi:hypothetical protein